MCSFSFSFLNHVGGIDTVVSIYRYSHEYSLTINNSHNMLIIINRWKKLQVLISVLVYQKSIWYCIDSNILISLVTFPKLKQSTACSTAPYLETSLWWSLQGKHNAVMFSQTSGCKQTSRNWTDNPKRVSRTRCPTNSPSESGGRYHIDWWARNKWFLPLFTAVKVKWGFKNAFYRNRLLLFCVY